jgi:hypothetical protein
MGGERYSSYSYLTSATRWGWVVSVTPRPRFTPYIWHWLYYNSWHDNPSYRAIKAGRHLVWIVAEFGHFHKVLSLSCLELFLCLKITYPKSSSNKIEQGATLKLIQCHKINVTVAAVAYGPANWQRNRLFLFLHIDNYNSNFMRTGQITYSLQ